MTEQTIAAALAGATVAALVGFALLKITEVVRKVRRIFRRWGRTRLILAQTTRRRRH
ncbi:hypothetical protein [Nocardiopsis dassonvillei]|uniref:hypothetical protein n=1 Tax=Nocardiopsis dassonvillei TaxID=2014 RepID=UPI00366BD792